MADGMNIKVMNQELGNSSRSSHKCRAVKQSINVEVVSILLCESSLYYA